MGKTIRVSEAFYELVKAHNQDGETMEETLQRMTRGPDPDDVAGILTDEQADEGKAAVDELRSRDSDRLRRARDAFAEDGE